MSEIKQFLILAATQKSRACVALIQQVLSNRKIFVFGELLSIPSVLSLKDSEYSKSFQTLELFTYGTYSDFLQHKDLYIELSEVQLYKLKQLTLLSIAEKQKILNYNFIQSALEISNLREMEDLIIDTIYAGLLSGKLDHRLQEFQVQHITSRDIHPNKLNEVIEKLKAWRMKSNLVQQTIEDNNSFLKSNKENTEIERHKIQCIINEFKLNADKIAEDNDGMEYYDEADMDYDDIKSPRRSNSRGLVSKIRNIGNTTPNISSMSRKKAVHTAVDNPSESVVVKSTM